jgi:hypothetical protein
MSDKHDKLILIVVIGLLLVACGSDSKDVPSLGATPTPEVEDAVLDDEAKVMTFVQCMRDQDIEYKDPVVDSEGNVQRPEFVEGVTYTREEIAVPYEVCSEHLVGLTLGRERGDISEKIDEYVALAECLNEKGYEVDVPTAETLKTWLTDFRVEFDWDDPEAKEAYEECSSTE